ncbi:MAG: TIGR03084 family metal-binding protein [Gammaproteobacteria bacterium]|nr:TIGR03084 family metal-binding protein [Gammaproteobacteria bacterium]
MQQIYDFFDEGRALYEFLTTLEAHHWNMETPFKNRTVNWVVQHLHDADRWAYHSITDPEGFRNWMRERANGKTFDYTKTEGNDLLEQWFSYMSDLCKAMGEADPNLRAPWFGPDMGIRMMATARQMETWSHGQDVYDLLGVNREHTDRVKNICHIGVRTFEWTFVNRKLKPPAPAPYVRLNAPSGAIWEWNDHSDHNFIKGSAVDFGRVVTQGRNIADVELQVSGDSANSWMAIAQCFAGPPEDPPAPGHRTGL